MCSVELVTKFTVTRDWATSAYTNFYGEASWNKAVLKSGIDIKGNIKIYLMDIGPSHYGMEIEVVWVTSKWQAFCVSLADPSGSKSREW